MSKRAPKALELNSTPPKPQPRVSTNPGCMEWWELICLGFMLGMVFTAVFS